MDWQQAALFCPICKSLHTGKEAFNKHYLEKHDLLSSYQCGQERCLKRFLDRTSMMRHITSKHLSLAAQAGGSRANCSSNSDRRIQPECVPPINLPSADFDLTSQQVDASRMEVEGEEEEEDALLYCMSIQEQLNDAATKMLIELRSTASLTGKAVERFENGCSKMIEQYGASLKTKLSSSLLEKGLSPADIEEVLKDICVDDPFRKLKTIEDQLNYFAETCGLVIPVEKLLDTRIDQRLDPHSNEYVPAQVNETFQYVSIIGTLKSILAIKRNRNRIFKDYASKDGGIRSYVDGNHYKNHPFLQKHENVILILLYYDDLEIANALGSKTIIHKLGAFFFQIINSPATESSELSSIHLLALVCADDMKKPGAFDKVLASFTQEMKKLSSDEGVTIRIDNEVFVMRAVVVALTADTLAAHDLLGFIGAGARHFCRWCMVSRPEVRANANAIGELRTVELHSSHLQQVSRQKKFSTNCGVRRACPLDEVPFFHCLTNNVFDAFHDLLEGVVPLVIKLVLRHYIIKQKLLSLLDFNAKVASFSYGIPDSKNKPSPNFSKEMLTKYSQKIKQTGSQMWCLVRTLPFLLADFVSEVDEHLELVFLLQNMMQIILSFEIKLEDIDELEELISRHNTLFEELFIRRDIVAEEEDEDAPEEDNNVVGMPPEVEDENAIEENGLEEISNEPEEDAENEDVVRLAVKKKPEFKVYIINKLHHLKHYPDMIREFGNPVRMWCGKFEGRLKIFRQHSAVCCNFKNPPKTMAQMFQLSNLKSIIGRHSDEVIEHQKGRSFKLCQNPSDKELLELFIKPEEDILYTNCATLNGEAYRPGLFVCLPSKTRIPVFGLIRNVIVVAGIRAYLIVQPWSNDGLDARYNAYKVSPGHSPQPVVISTSALANYRCIAPWTTPQSGVFLSLRTVLI